jgi:hypothetical protein
MEQRPYGETKEGGKSKSNQDQLDATDSNLFS